MGLLGGGCTVSRVGPLEGPFRGGCASSVAFVALRPAL